MILAHYCPLYNVMHETGTWQIVVNCENKQRFWSCRITFPVRSGKGKKRKDVDGEDEDTEEAKTLIVEPHVIPNRGPYPYNQPIR